MAAKRRKTPRQNPKLTITFKDAYRKSPLLSSSKVSKLKVENVLIPPQKPTRTNILSEVPETSFCWQYMNIIAKIAQLITFADNVATGNVIFG